MYNTFSFVGKIKPIKDTDNFKAYEERKFDSGWTKRALKFNIVCGNNRHMLQIDGGCFPDGHGDIYTKFEENVDGKRVYSNTKVPFANRFNEDVVAAVPNFLKYTVDTEEYGKRGSIASAADKLKVGDVPDNCPFKSYEEAESALEKSKAKRKEFISTWDFVESVNKLVNNEKVKDILFKVTGDVKYSYYNGRYYRAFVPTKIYRVSADTEQTSEANLCLYFTEGAVEESKDNKYFINAFVRDYDSNTKKMFGIPVTVVNCIEGDGKKARAINKRFEVDGNEYRELGVKCQIIDGSSTVSITEDMLSEEQRENLEFGLITIEDIKAEYGGEVYGERINETRVVGLVKGYTSGSKDTAYTSDDFAAPTVQTDDIDIDLFEDEDIDI